MLKGKLLLIIGLTYYDLKDLGFSGSGFLCQSWFLIFFLPRTMYEIWPSLPISCHLYHAIQSPSSCNDLVNEEKGKAVCTSFVQHIKIPFFTSVSSSLFCPRNSLAFQTNSLFLIRIFYFHSASLFLIVKCLISSFAHFSGSLFVFFILIPELFLHV